MKQEQYYKYGLLAFVVMAILFVCAAAYERLSHSGMSTIALWLSVIALALLLGGIYLLLSGVIFEFFSWLMRRCGKLKPEGAPKQEPEAVKCVVPEVTPVAVSPESEQDRRVLENAIDTICRYTDLVFGDAVSDNDKKLLHIYLVCFAR